MTNTETSEEPEQDEQAPPMSAYRRAALEGRRLYDARRRRSRSRNKVRRKSRKQNRR